MQTEVDSVVITLFDVCRVHVVLSCTFLVVLTWTSALAFNWGNAALKIYTEYFGNETLHHSFSW